MNTALLDLITLLNTVFVGSGRSIALTIGSVPIDSLYCIVPCTITARFRKGRNSIVKALCNRQRSSRCEWIVVRRGFDRKISTHYGPRPGEVLRDLNFYIA